MSRDGTTQLYDSLARFQWWRRCLCKAAAGEGLEMRKRLLPPVGDGPSDGAAGLDRWLQQQLGERPRLRLLDLGCGFGASMLRWLQAGTERATGVTPSAYQVRRAGQMAKALGVADRCQWLCQPLEASLPGQYDVVIAVEALGHTRDLPLVLRNVRRAMHNDGVFLWVEDLLTKPLGDDPDVRELAAAWHSPPLRDLDSVRAAMAGAQLAVVDQLDLTAQVQTRTLAALDRSVRRLSRWHRLVPLPFSHRLSTAFLGGSILERLYLRGVACYRFAMAQPVAESA